MAPDHCPSLTGVRTEPQGKTLDARAEAEAMERMLLNGLFSVACLPCCYVQTWTTSLGVVPPTGA